MNDIVSIVKTDLLSNRSVILGEGKGKKIGMAIVLAISIIFAEFTLVKLFNTLHQVNMEILVFNFLINIELIGIIFLVFAFIMNKFYLASDWKEMLIYPIKSGSLLLSKSVVCYFLSLLVPMYLLLALLTYGFLTNGDIFYYLYVILYQIIIGALITVYITLIMLTVFWIISVVKKSKVKHRSNKWIIFINLAVALLTYILIKPSLDKNIGLTNLINNIFFNGNPATIMSYNALEVSNSFLIALAIIGISYIGLYLIGGNVYLTIMKSGIFTSNNSKETQDGIGGYEFKVRNPIISNIIRDIKLIIRIPALRSNCFIGSSVLSIISIIMIILLYDKIIVLGDSLNGLKSFLILTFYLFLAVFNFTPITTFSREGRALSQFNVYPIENKSFILSKICVGIISNILPFISANVLLLLMAFNFSEFILIEIVVIIYTVCMPIVLASIDLNSMELKWIDIKDLFMGRFVKAMVPFYLITLLLPGAILLSRVLNFEINEYLNISYFICIIGIYTIFSLRRIKKNMVK